MKTSNYQQTSYDGGHNDTVSPQELARNEGNPLRNWCIQTKGKLTRRYGLTQVGSTLSNAAAGLHAYLRTGGGKDLLVMDGTSLKYLNSSTFDTLDSGFTSGKNFWMENCPVNDKVYISNEDNTTHSWDRAAAAGAVGSASFTGAGLDDATFGGTYTGGGQTYKVEIDGTGTPDTFRWSDDGGSTWEVEDVAITGAAQTLNNGVTVTFAATTGHTATDFWTSACTSVLADLGNTHWQANVMRWHKNHMFFLNNLTLNSTVYENSIGWSAMGDPDTHDTGNDRIDIPGNGRVITAVDQGNVLVIFKERSVVYLSGWGDSDWRITASASNVANLSEQVGCIAPRGATRVGNEVWFVDDEGVIRRIYQTDFDAYRSDHISTKLKTTLGGINKAQLAKAVAWTNNDHVYFAFPNGSDVYNSIVVAFDILASKRNGGEEAWEIITGWTPVLFSDYLPSAVPVLYMADATEGKIYSNTGNDDDGVAIDANWTGKDDDYDKPDNYKRYRFGYLQAESGSGDVDVDIYASVDMGSFADLGAINLQSEGSTLGPTGTGTLGPTGTFILGGSGKAEFKFYYTSGGGSARGRSLRHSIRHAVINEQPVVSTFTSHFKLKPVR